MRSRVMRWAGVVVVAALGGAGGCGGDGPAGPTSPVAGVWRGDRGTRLVVRASGDSVLGALQPATAPGAPPAATTPLCGRYVPPQLALGSCPSGEVRYVVWANLTPAGDTLVAQWGASQGYSDIVLTDERFGRSR